MPAPHGVSLAVFSEKESDMAANVYKPGQGYVFVDPSKNGSGMKIG